IVFSGFVIAWRLATWPTSRSPLLVKATTDGVVRPPSGFVMTLGSPPSITATTELVVPKSMPMIFPIGCASVKILEKSVGLLRRCFSHLCLSHFLRCSDQTLVHIYNEALVCHCQV